MSEYRLAIQGPSGRFQVSVAPSSTLDALQDIIAEKGNVVKALQKLSSGFPPKDIAIEPQKTIQEIGIANGDMIRVSALPEPAAAPVSAAVGGSTESVSSGVGSLGLESGRRFVRKVIPADNSCLFNSVAYCMEGRRMDMAAELRELIASVVLSDPAEYSESVLSKGNAEYAAWIQEQSSWGGAIECRILADHYRTEIVAIDVQTLRPYRFGEDKEYGERIFLVYDGIHYDVIAEALAGPEQEELYATVFNREDSEGLSRGLVEGLKRAGKFTDVPNMTARCLVCGQGLAGAEQMQAHAAATGHINFGEAS